MLKHCIKSQTVQSRLEAAVKHDSIDTASGLMGNIFVEVCNEAGLKARSGKIKCKSQNKWFDQECEKEKGNLQSLGEKNSKNPNVCPAYQEKRRSLLDYLEKEYRINISRMSPNKGKTTLLLSVEDSFAVSIAKLQRSLIFSN